MVLGRHQRRKSCDHHCSSGAMLDRVTETPSAMRFGKFNVGYPGYAGILKDVMPRLRAASGAGRIGVDRTTARRPDCFIFR